MKVLQGYRYSVTANEEVTVTDENGLNLTCPAGQQTYFTATCDEVEVSGDAVITQARGHITIGSGGGGGEKIAPGEVVVGGTQGSAFIVQLNECTRCPIFIDEELPEGVTFEKLESGIIANAKAGVSLSMLSNVFPSDNPYAYGRIFARTTITQLPDSINFTSLTNGSYMFYYCSSLASFNSDLPVLTNGAYMFGYCSSLESFNGALSALTDSTYMFGYCSKLASFNSDLSALTSGTYMFGNCSKLASFNGNLPVLTNGTNMFYFCSSLESFNGNLPVLTSGSGMFNTCSKLASFNSDLPALTDGSSMFRSCSKLESFNINLPVLTNSTSMFYGCTSLASFNGALSALTDGTAMFQGCTGLASFNGDLSALTNGSSMFANCKFDLASVNRIVSTVPSYTSGTHRITIGVDSTKVSQEQQDAANTILVGKGWTATWQRRS